MKWQCLARFKKKKTNKFFITGYSELVLPRGFFVGYSYFFFLSSFLNFYYLAMDLCYDGRF